MPSDSAAPDVGKLLILAGLALVVAGVAWKFGLLRWFGRLPGDLRWESGGTRVFVPITSMLIASVGLSAASWLASAISRWLSARS